MPFDANEDHAVARRRGILQQLNQATHDTGSQFAILWVHPTGQEVFSSGAFREKLDAWLPPAMLAEASQVAHQAALRRDPARGSPPLDVYTTRGRVVSLKMDDEESHRTEKAEQNGDCRPAPSPSRPSLSASISYSRAQSFTSTSFSSPSDPASNHVVPSPRPPASAAYPSPALPFSPASDTAPSSTPPHSPWFADQISQWSERTGQMICNVWSNVVDPDKASRQHVGSESPRQPSWWPTDVRYVNPDQLVASERVTVLAALLRGSGVSIDHFEMATRGILAMLPTSDVTILKDLYSAVRRERATPAIAHSDSPPTTVRLSPPMIAKHEEAEPSPLTRSTRNRRLNDGISGDAPAARLRNSHPYARPQSGSLADPKSVEPRPLARSQSLTVAASAREKPNAARNLRGSFTAEGDRRRKSGSVADSVPALQRSQSTNGIALQPPIDLGELQLSTSGSADDPSRHIRASPSGRRLSRSNEPAFASPEMIKPRAHVGAMSPLTEEVQPRRTSQVAPPPINYPSAMYSHESGPFPPQKPPANPTSLHSRQYPSPAITMSSAPSTHLLPQGPMLQHDQAYIPFYEGMTPDQRRALEYRQEQDLQAAHFHQIAEQQSQTLMTFQQPGGYPFFPNTASPQPDFYSPDSLEMYGMAFAPTQPSTGFDPNTMRPLDFGVGLGFEILSGGLDQANQQDFHRRRYESHVFGHA